MGKTPLLAAAVAGLLLAGCVEQLAVSNQKDSFSLGGQVADKTGQESWTWDNTQGKADVHWGGQAASGSFTLVIKDAGGKQVYSKSVSGASQSGSSEPTASGQPGDWTVTVAFEDFTGQVGLNLNAKFDPNRTGCIPGVPGC